MSNKIYISIYIYTDIYIYIYKLLQFIYLFHYSYLDAVTHLLKYGDFVPMEEFQGHLNEKRRKE